MGEAKLAGEDVAAEGLRRQGREAFVEAQFVEPFDSEAFEAVGAADLLFEFTFFGDLVGEAEGGGAVRVGVEGDGAGLPVAAVGPSPALDEAVAAPRTPAPQLRLLAALSPPRA